MGAVCSHTRFNQFMKVETFVSLTMFGVCIYMFIMAQYYYVRHHSGFSAILGVLGSLFFLFGVSTAIEVITLWRALRKRDVETGTNPVRRVRFSSLLNIYEESDQSIYEEPSDDSLNRENEHVWPGNARQRNGEIRDLNSNIEEAGGATGGLSPDVEYSPRILSFESWMSLGKDNQMLQDQNNSFRERINVWHESKDSCGKFEEIQPLSLKDNELFENDNGEEMTI